MPTTWSDPDHHVETPYCGSEHVDLATNHGDAVGGGGTQVNGIDAVRVRENGFPKLEYDTPQTWCSPLKFEQWSTH